MFHIKLIIELIKFVNIIFTLSKSACFITNLPENLLINHFFVGPSFQLHFLHETQI